jgi:DNA polymerase-1
MHLVETHEDVEEFFRWLGERRPILGFDTETGGLEWWHMRLRTVQFGDAMRGWTIPWEWWAGVPREVFRTYQGPMVAHNATFDIRFLERHGLQLPRFIDDTFTMAHVLDPNRPLGLKELSKKFIDPMADAGQKALREGMKKNGWTWDTVPVDFLPYWVYSALDPIETARLWELFSPQIDAAGPAIRELYEREIVVDRMMSDASVPGVRIDEEYARQERARLWDDVVRLRAEVEEEWGMSPSADVKVAERLVADGMPLTERTATGRVKLDAAALEGLEGKHPLADQVLQFRRASKFVAAYFDGVLKRLDGDRVHCEIRTLGARTGRMSVAQPALQQIPSHDTSVRRMFIPGEGNVLMSIDFSNIEVRILAHLCRDETMMNAFLADADVHMEMARAMYGPDAGKAERKHSKSGTLGKIYGIGTKKFAKQQGVTVEEAEKFMAFYDEKFPGVTDFVRAVEYTARHRLKEEGTAYVQVDGGRKHQLTYREAAEWEKFYTLVNYICQGTAAELLKEKIVALRDAGLAEYIRLPVHDEILFEVPVEKVYEVGSLALEVMEDRSLTKWAVPITCDLEIYDESWAQSVEGARSLSEYAPKE